MTDHLCEAVQDSLPCGWELNIRFACRDGLREIDVWLTGPDGEEWPDRRHCKTVEDEILNAVNSARDYYDLPPVASLSPEQSH